MKYLLTYESLLLKHFSEKSSFLGKQNEQIYKWLIHIIISVFVRAFVSVKNFVCVYQTQLCMDVQFPLWKRAYSVEGYITVWRGLLDAFKYEIKAIS